MGTDGELFISPEEYEGWLPPRIVLDRLQPLTRHDAINSISARFLSGTLRMAVYKATQVTTGKPAEEHNFIIISNRLFAAIHLPESFWTTSDLTIFPDQLGDVDYNHMRVPGRLPTLFLVGVRFDPADIDRLIDHAGIRPQGPTESLATRVPLAPEAGEHKPVAAAFLASTTRKPISPATLKAWWDMCKTIKAPGVWSADDMRDFFKQCFPDKSVTRDQLRDVRGKQTSGPKPKSAE